MNCKIEHITNNLRSEIDKLAEMNDQLARLNETYTVVKNWILEVRKYINDHEFKDKEEEIEFFKKTKPEILAYEIGEGLKYSLQVNKPIGTTDVLLKYYEQQLKIYHGFFEMNAFHYQYYKNGLTVLDSLYFIRSSGPLPLPLADMSEIDDNFSTPMSYLFAKFIAYEQLQYHILELMATLQSAPLKQIPPSTANNEISWTGPLINVVELVYGLWLTGQLNNGNASLNQIVRWMENSFHINIGIVQRRFNEIARRKRLSLTKFIDQMQQAIVKKIDDTPQ